MKQTIRLWTILIALILILAFLIRVWNLTKESFWADEGWTMLLAKGPDLQGVVQTMAADQHPPLYFVLLHYWMRLTGNSEFSIRYLSLIWSVIGVALIYRLGADIFSPTTGALAALLLALADNDTFLAQDARHYTQMATLAIASTLFYLRYFRYPQRVNGIAWLLSSVALMYTHYLGAFILIVQFIHVVIFARPARRFGDLFLRLMAIGIAWLPWAFVFINQSLIRYTRPILFQSTWPNTPEALSIVRGDLIGSHFGLTGGLLLVGLTYITYGSGFPKISWRPAWPTMYAALWLFVPIITIIVINERYPILTTRNFLLVTPVIALLIAHGITNLDRFARILVLIILVVVSLITVDAYFIKPPWREVSQDILRYRTASEPILMDVWTDGFALRYHIGRDLHSDPDTLPLVMLPEWRFQYRDAFYPTLLAYLRDKPAFWLAYWGEENGEILRWLSDQGYKQTAQQVETHLQTNNIYVYRYDRVTDDTPELARFGEYFGLVSAQVGHEGSALRVNVLWNVLQKPPVDYSFSVFLLDPSGRSVVNNDAPPLSGTSATSQWKVGELHFDSKTLELPANLTPGTYQVGLKVYWYVDQKPLLVIANGQENSEYFIVDLIEIQPG